MVVRGTVGVKYAKEETGGLEVNAKVCYDGDSFGEMVHFEPTSTMSKTMLATLNVQRTTCTALEQCYLLALDKLRSQSALTPSSQAYQCRIEFLRQIDLFSELPLYILLPLASNIQVLHFKMGEYILKAGELPEGLMIVNSGQCLVCAEKLAMRSKKASQYKRIQVKKRNVVTNPTGSVTTEKKKERMRNEVEQYWAESLLTVNGKGKTWQNEEVLVDDKGRRMGDMAVYKDLVRLGLWVSVCVDGVLRVDA